MNVNECVGMRYYNAMGEELMLSSFGRSKG